MPSASELHPVLLPTKAQLVSKHITISIKTAIVNKERCIWHIQESRAGRQSKGTMATTTLRTPHSTDPNYPHRLLPLSPPPPTPPPSSAFLAVTQCTPWITIRIEIEYSARTLQLDTGVIKELIITVITTSTTPRILGFKTLCSGFRIQRHSNPEKIKFLLRNF